MDVPSMIMGAAIASVVWIALWPRKRPHGGEDATPGGSSGSTDRPAG